jgi:hypothetical protein
MPRRSVWVPTVVALAAVAGLWWWTSGRAEPASRAAAAREPAPTARSADATPAPPVSSHAQAPASEAQAGEGLDAMAEAWAAVDMEEIRRALPDNLYWQMAAPTQDLREIDRRAEERARWNEEYGRILAGDASEPEIQTYYDQRTRLSSDYVEFVDYLLGHYGNQLPERDVGMLKLASRLHLARLEEIPRKRQEALERKEQQDRARERWRQEQRTFEDGDGSSPK